MSQDYSPAFSEELPHIPQNRYRAARDLVLDYALSAAIIGLNPFPNLFILTLILASVLLLKMRRDMQKLWNVLGRKRAWASTDRLLGGIGALSTAFMAWLTLIIVSAFIPWVHRFAISASLFALVWMVLCSITAIALRA